MYSSDMGRKVSLVIVPSCLLLLMMGCTQVRELPVGRIAPPSPAAQPTGGEAQVAVPFPMTLFGPPLRTASVQPGTLKLKKLILSHPRLKVTPLASSHRTVALGFQEKASGKQRWGEIMIPEERKLFQRFAEDTSLGEWLILITDVDVTDAPDPIPLVAYRWNRPDVETYAKCGIPLSLTINECTDTYYRAAKVIFLMHQKIGQGQ
ncbi:MAG TPA: hypothetical protein VGL18_08635 [Actinomycetota bacterium]